MASKSCTCRKAGGTPADNLRDTLLVAALYWAVSHITKTFFSSFGVLPMPIWPAASVAVAAGIIRGWRVAAGIAIGSVLANAVSLGSSWPVACGIAVMNTAGPLLCAGIIKRHASSMPPFSRIKDALLFLAWGVIIMAALTATGGIISIVAGGRITIAQAPAAWLRWWIAHAGGALLFTPLLLCWWENHRPQPRPALVRFLTAAAVTLLITALMFFAIANGHTRFHELPYLLIIPLAWIAVRFDAREAMTVFSFMVMTAMVATVTGRGPFAGGELPMVALGLMVVSYGLTVLFVGAVAAERRQAGQAVRESEQQFRAIANYTADWENWIGTDGRLVWVNPAVEKHTGYSADECRAMQDFPFPLIHPLDRDMLRRHYADAISGNSAGGIEFRIVRRDGLPRWMSVSYNPIFDAQGKSLGHRSSVHDITTRKTVEEALRQATEQWQATFNAAHDAIALLDTGHRILQCNRAMTEMFDKPLAALRNRYCWEIVHKTAQPLPECPVERMRKSLRREQMELRRGDRWFQVTADPLLDKDRTLLGSVHIVRDITRQKQAEEQRLTLERQLLHAQKLESLGVLAGGIAHDFNNILAAMLGYVELALDDLPPGSAARGDILELEKAVHRATDLARQMLAYTGKGKGDIQVLALNSLVQDMSHLLSVSVPKKVALRCNLDGSLPEIQGDGTQMRQVIMNLITNAAEAIGDSSGTVTITTGALQCDRDYLDGCADVCRTAGEPPLPEGRYVYLEVADTGCGLDRQTRERLFDPFFSTKFTGRGLGMAVVLGIVRGHRAGIRIDSEAGRGTTFRILFPAGAAGDAPVAENDPAPDLREWHGSGLVLLVDDEESIRYTSMINLRKLGFDVIAAADGNEGLAVFRSNADRIVCVLLDMTMPGMHGDELLREMRVIRPDVPVILSSGFTEQDAAMKLVRQGAALFLPKPYRRPELAAKLQEALEKPRV